ncbi:hypothetical protein [Psychroserpens sp. NJDZ02]|uniref:hypothetical protein n=1 Tax=Psychroserpens sp. NJDZ02 TaxID=2570561 RepID=UPI0010A949EE|nr:hypothetical protein [Psychroserpens sp. NJDZ02]QCE41150.1 hypothetical protein E9099_06870 [Psychroserpens sp. NJDZ02]
MKTNSLFTTIILMFTVVLISCSSDETQESEPIVLPPDLTNEITIYNNTAILDATDLTGSQ